jgi:hypothetical protein
VWLMGRWSNICKHRRMKNLRKKGSRIASSKHWEESKKKFKVEDA